MSELKTTINRCAVAITACKISNTSPPDEDIIDISGFSWGSVKVGTGIQTGTFTFWGCESRTGTFAIIKDKNGTSATIPITNDATNMQGYEIPSSVFTWPHIRIHTSVAGDDAESVTLVLKT